MGLIVPDEEIVYHYLKDEVPLHYVIRSLNEFWSYLQYMYDNYVDWQPYCLTEYNWFSRSDNYHKTELRDNTIIYTKFYELGKSTPVSIPHEHSVLELGLKPLIKYIRHGRIDVVYNNIFTGMRNEELSCIANIELIDGRVMNIVKGYKKTKRGTDVPTYYVNKAQYNGEDYKRLLKEIALNYDAIYKPKF